MKNINYYIKKINGFPRIKNPELKELIKEIYSNGREYERKQYMGIYYKKNGVGK